MKYQNEPASTMLVDGPLVSNASLATILFVVAEVMLFVGFISGYVVLRYGSNQFMGMQSLPMGLTAYSTPILVASSITLILAWRAQRRGVGATVRSMAIATLLLGLLFVLLQGIEWNRLISDGLIPATSVSSGMFYLLSGVHGVHVAGGLVLLGILVAKAYGGNVASRQSNFLTVASIYWHFVTILWVTLYVMIFLL